MASVTKINPTTTAVDVAPLAPNHVMRMEYETSPESAKTSPWAKLISERMP
jgi:hypothetical protein